MWFAGHFLTSPELELIIRQLSSPQQKQDTSHINVHDIRQEEESSNCLIILQ